MTDITCYASQEAVEAAAALSDMLSGRAAGRHDDAFFARDWSALWEELGRGGWLDVGKSLRAGASSSAQFLVDCTALAEAWSERLVPLPFIEHLVGDETIGDVAASESRLVPFPALLESPSVESVDGFAPSLPIGRVQGLQSNSAALAAVRGASAVACAALTFDGAVDYSRSRVAYDRPIGSYQALKHLMADMHTQIEMARSEVIWACHEQDRAVELAVDIFRRCRWVIARCIQIYGGIGYTWEAGVHFYARHVMALEKLTQAGLPRDAA